MLQVNLPVVKATGPQDLSLLLSGVEMTDTLITALVNFLRIVNGPSVMPFCQVH